MPRHLNYQLVDVFTDTPFGGNQLAVFTDGGGLSTATMQMIARELNLSESVFIMPPDAPENHFKLRIFTPKMEVPFAGHPTVGTGYVLHSAGLIKDTSIRLEEGVGVINVTIHPQENGAVTVTMQQPIPQFGAIFEDRALIAALLSLETDDLVADLPVQVVSSGVPFLYVPVKSLAAIGAIKVRLDLWEKHLQHSGSPHIFAFTPEVERAGSTVHSRMFGPAFGIPEDPATGAASGPLGAYLVRYGLVEGEAARHILSEQGMEMGRPSFIQICVEGTPDNMTYTSIGGVSQPIGAGTIYLPDGF
jgi:trans-2,3-dihydro-3-hydroxyanthranilate isomerase